QIDRMPIGLIVWDTEFRVTSWNPTAEKIFGFTAQEAMGEHPYGLIVPKEAQPHVDDIWGRLLQGDTTAHTINDNITKDGRTIICQWSNTPLKGADGTVRGVLSMVQDITARKLAEDKLRITQFAVDCAAEPIAWVGKDGRYLYANDIYCGLLNYSKDEFLSLRICDLNHNVSEESWSEHWEKIKQQGSHVYETSRLSKDGVPIPLEIHANYLSYEDKEFIVTFCRDIRERKLHEEQLKRQVERLSAQRDIDMAIIASLDIRVTLDVFLERVIASLHVDAADILLLDLSSYNQLNYVAGRGFRTNALQHTKLSIGAGYAGRIAQERKAVCIPDLQKEPSDLLEKSPQLSSEDFVSYHGVPLIAKGQVKGVLEIFNRTPLEHDQDWLDFVEALAMQAAIAIDSALLFDDLQKSNINLIQAYDSTLEGWSNALDLRDKETEGHSQRVTEITL
ncbi:MAG: PAS domain S-box protein, partial [Pseudomonadota bacterium]